MFHYWDMYIFFYYYSNIGWIAGVKGGGGGEREEKQVQSTHLAPCHLHLPFYNCHAG